MGIGSYKVAETRFGFLWVWILTNVRVSVWCAFFRVGSKGLERQPRIRKNSEGGVSASIRSAVRPQTKVMATFSSVLSQSEASIP